MLNYLCFTLSHTKKRNIMNPSIKLSEEFKGEVTLFLSNGHEVKFETSKLIDYIEASGLNVTDTYGGNSGIGEPWLDNETVECVEDCESYLDNNFDSVCESYYKNVICK